MIDQGRCKFCGLHIILNPFVGEWHAQGVNSQLCSDNPDEWKQHLPVNPLNPDAVMKAIGDLLGVLAA